MKILLVGNYPLDEQESMRRYTAMLADALRQRGHAVTTIAPAPVLGRLGRSRGGTRKWLGYVDKFVLFPRTLRRAARAADIVHICDHSNAMYVRSVGKKPHLVTCHDVLAIRSALGHFPENRVSPTGRVLQRLIMRGLTRAQGIACVSENTCDDLHRYLQIPKERLRVVHLSLNWPFRPLGEAPRRQILEQLGIPGGRPYFLHVGANHWYKNRFAVLPIFRALRQQAGYGDALLVLAGQPCPPEFRTYLSQHGLAGAAIDLPGCSNEQLQALYSGAEALIFPSLHEGFGWPILEAQACGCPVATCDRPPMNAVSGHAAISIDPGDPAGSAMAIAGALQHRPALREAGLRNAARFTSGAMTDGYLAAYSALASGRTLPCV